MSELAKRKINARAHIIVNVSRPVGMVSATAARLRTLINDDEDKGRKKHEEDTQAESMSEEQSERSTAHPAPAPTGLWAEQAANQA